MPRRGRRKTSQPKIVAHVRKVTITRPIPKNAKILTKGDKHYVRVKCHGQTVDAIVTADGKTYRAETPEYYVRYKDADGVWRRERAYTDLEATETLCATIRKREERKQAGLVDLFDEHYKRPLSEHVADFEAAMRQRERAEKHVRQVVAKVTNVLTKSTFDAKVEGKTVAVAGCGFQRIPDIEAFRVQLVLADLRSAGLSVQTCKHYLRAIKQFCKWLMNNRRTNDNPITHLEPGNVEEDRRRVRRDLSAEEVQRLLEAAASSSRTFRQLTGTDRFVIYYLALGSGLRVSEVASLTPESFDLDGQIPIVVLEAGASKRRRRDEQPLQPDLVAILRDYLINKPAGEPLWPGSWSDRAAEMLRVDLEAAGIPYVDDSGRYADFHAQRHTYITVAGRNLPPKMAQLLARHSDYKTTERYTHLQLHDTGSAAAQLPPLLPEKKGDSEELRATGTHDKKPLTRWGRGILPTLRNSAKTCTNDQTEEEPPDVVKMPGNPAKTREKGDFQADERGCSNQLERLLPRVEQD